MRKSVILAAVALSIVACKKSEMANQYNTETNDASAIALKNSTKEDSSSLVLNEIAKMDKEAVNKIHEKAVQETNFSIDSMAKSNQKIPKVLDETTPSTEEKEIVSNPSMPQIIKETKIIYKEKPSSKSNTTNPIKKYGNLSFSVEDNDTAISQVRYLVKKYDGKIKSENLTSNNQNNTNYIVAKIPLKEYDYLIEDLLDNIGTLNDKNLEITGENYQPNKLCDIEITLYSKNTPIIKNENEAKTFGGKAFNAIVKGWEVIGKIILFFLPFWPIFLIIVLGIFYFKKKDTITPKE